MIIGFDGSRAFTKDKTGTENYSYQLLYHLAKIDHKNTYKIYLRPSGTQGQALETRGWPENFKFITISNPRLWTQAGLAHQTFKEPLDVLFIPAHTLPLVRKPGLKTVVTVHDLGAEFLPATHQLKQRLYLNLMTHHQLKSATHLIAVSKATKQDLIKKVGIPESKISVVYEGFNQDLFKPVKNDVLINTLKEFDLVPQDYVLPKAKGKVLQASSKISHTASEASPYFLFVGTIQPRKNIERLIRAYTKFLAGDAEERSRASTAVGLLAHEDAPEKPERQDPQENKPQLVLVGSKGWLSDKIYKLPKELGIENQVKFLGYVPDEKLPALYAGAKALLFPSLFEGFGLPVLEAFALNCPVLTSNVSSLPEVAGKAALLVDPYSTDDIAQGINKLNTDQILREKLIQAGRLQLQKFSWQKCAQETLKVLLKA